MIKSRALIVFLFVMLLLGSSGVVHADPCIPGSPGFVSFTDCYTQTGQQAPTGAFEIIDIARMIAGFIIAISGVVAGIVIIIAGLVWMSAGANTQRITSAKAIFKNGVIGALILFASGIIINTVILLATSWSGFFS